MLTNHPPTLESSFQTLHIDTQPLEHNAQQQILSMNDANICFKQKNDIGFLSSTFIHRQPSQAHKRKLKAILRKLMKERAKQEERKALRGHGVTLSVPLEERISLLHIWRNYSKDQPPQRSLEWYKHRAYKITASHYGKLMSTSSVAKKTHAFTQALSIRNEDFSPKHFASGKACAWGNMMEPICCMLYVHFSKGTVVLEEFGLLCDKEHTYIGASPDAICNEQSTEEYVGRLVEFKAPFSRSIVAGHVPIEYLKQIQGQLHVTRLPCCDYAEYNLRTESRLDAMQRYERYKMYTEDEYKKKDQSPYFAMHAQGFIVQTMDETNHAIHYYGPINDIEDSTVEQQLLSMSQHQQSHAHITYWSLVDSQIVAVYRNEAYFNEYMLPHLQETWKYMKEFLDDDTLFQSEQTKREESALKRKKKKQAKGQQSESMFGFRGSS